MASLPRLALGTMNFGARTPEAESARIIDRALERDVRWFDTANLYNQGESERVLGRALRGRRDGVMLATKVGLNRVGGKPEGLSAARVLSSAKESLERLQTDRIDLYYLHAPDPATPFSETLDAIQSLLESKKVLAWGVSNFASWQILELEQLCAARAMPKPAVSQELYNLLIRQLDLEYFAFARAHPIHTTVFNPLAGGLLARAAGPVAPPRSGSRLATNKLYARRYGSERLTELAEEYRGIARDEGMELVSFAYAWLADRPGVDSILTGPGTLAHFDAAVDACARTVSPEARKRVDGLHQAYLGTDACYAR